jgi:hypothetical protein
MCISKPNPSSNLVNILTFAIEAELDLYLEINGISFGESILSFFKSIFGMSIKGLKVTDPFFAEEWPRDGTMESNDKQLKSARKTLEKERLTSTFHLIA